MTICTASYFYLRTLGACAVAAASFKSPCVLCERLVWLDHQRNSAPLTRTSDSFNHVDRAARFRVFARAYTCVGASWFSDSFMLHLAKMSTLRLLTPVERWRTQERHDGVADADVAHQAHFVLQETLNPKHNKTYKTCLVVRRQVPECFRRHRFPAAMLHSLELQLSLDPKAQRHRSILAVYFLIS